MDDPNFYNDFCLFGQRLKTMPRFKKGEKILCKPRGASSWYYGVYVGEGNHWSTRGLHWIAGNKATKVGVGGGWWVKIENIKKGNRNARKIQ